MPAFISTTAGVPSLKACKKLTVKGAVAFSSRVRIVGVRGGLLQRTRLWVELADQTVPTLQAATVDGALSSRDGGLSPPRGVVLSLLLQNMSVA